MGLRTFLGLKKRRTTSAQSLSARSTETARPKASTSHSNFSIVLDDEGIPHSEYGTYRGMEIGSQISPLCVAEHGLWCWNDFFRSDGERPVLISVRWDTVLRNPEKHPQNIESAAAVMLRCADWLLAHSSPRKDFLVWEYPYPMSYETPAGWCSAHTQAPGIQLLIRATEYSGKPRYLDQVDGFLRAFTVSVNDGGVAEELDDGAVWFEKFAHPANQRPKVLNGHLFAVLGLFDIAQRLGRPDIQSLAERGLAAALVLMPRFDRGDGSAYNILGARASLHYHEIVIEQLSRLYQLMGDTRLMNWRDRFVALKSGYALTRRASTDGAA